MAAARRHVATYNFWQPPSGIVADVTLPTTGTYTVFMDPGAKTGSMTLQLFNTSDVPITGLTIGGPAVNMATNSPGQDFSGTFSGTAGQQISLNITNSTIPCCQVMVYIIPPGGNVSNAIATYNFWQPPSGIRLPTRRRRQ